MAAYLIASYDIEDKETYDLYQKDVGRTLLKHGAQVLAASYNVKVIEGNPAQVNVVIKFPSDASAMAWYNDPEYEEIKAHRLAATSNSTMVIAEQFDPSKR